MKKLKRLPRGLKKLKHSFVKHSSRKRYWNIRAKELTRKERTHRLCTRGAILESYFPQPEAVTDEQVEIFLKVLFHQSDTHELMQRIFSNTQKEETE